MITYAGTRKEAIDRMTRAIDEYKITGVTTTLPFCKFAINHEAFKSGNFDTHFVQSYFTPDVLDESNEGDYLAIAAFLADRSSSNNQNLFESSEQKTNTWKLQRRRY